jgi:hypothetical protein
MPRRKGSADLLGSTTAPDETTILNLGHLLEEHDCGERITTGTIVDVTTLHAPASIKKERVVACLSPGAASGGNQAG